MKATELFERKLSKGEEKEKERIVKGMKKAKGDFKDRYGKDAEAVMYATATKMAKGESVEEGYKILDPIDREKYQPRDGLEGPFQTVVGKVVYYDPKEGKYYDPDTDMYLSYDEWKALDGLNMDPSSGNRTTPTKEHDEPLSGKELMKQYNDNEHNNYHSENNLLLAKTFGTPKEVQMVQLILKKNQRQGYTSNEDSEWMYQNINKKYYPMLVKKSMEEGFAEAKKEKNCGCGKDPCITYGKQEESCGSKHKKRKVKEGMTREEQYVHDSFQKMFVGIDRLRTFTTARYQLLQKIKDIGGDPSALHNLGKDLTALYDRLEEAHYEAMGHVQHESLNFKKVDEAFGDNPTATQALRLMVGSNNFAKAKRALEMAKAGKSVPANFMAGLFPLLDLLENVMSGSIANTRILQQLNKRAKDRLKIKEKAGGNMEGYLNTIDEYVEMLFKSAKDKRDTEIAYRIQNAVDDIRTRELGLKPSLIRAKYNTAEAIKEHSEHDEVKAILDKHNVKSLDDIDYGSKVYLDLFGYYMDSGEMPYGVMKARDGDPDQWIADRVSDLGLLEDGSSHTSMNKYGLSARNHKGKFYSYRHGKMTGVFDSMEELAKHQEELIRNESNKSIFDESWD